MKVMIITIIQCINNTFPVKLKQYHAAFNTFERALDQARLQGISLVLHAVFWLANCSNAS